MTALKWVFCDLRVLARKLASPFGHPTQVSTQVHPALGGQTDSQVTSLAHESRKKSENKLSLHELYIFCISLANNRSIDVTRFDVFSNVFRPRFAGRIQKPANDHPSFLNLCLRKTRSGKSRDYRDVIVF